jgi:hypothetical protein
VQSYPAPLFFTSRAGVRLLESHAPSSNQGGTHSRPAREERCRRTTTSVHTRARVKADEVRGGGAVHFSAPADTGGGYPPDSMKWRGTQGPRV